MDDDLNVELDRISAERDRDNMAPTIAALTTIYDRHPNDARVLYELGGAHDTAGQEEIAVGFYQRALDEGLSGDIRRRCLLQFGSTLRNLGRLQESASLFALARGEFPNSVSLGAFEALTLHAAGFGNSAVGSLLELLADHVEVNELERYKPALRGNAEYLRGLDPRSDSDR